MKKTFYLIVCLALTLLFSACSIYSSDVLESSLPSDNRSMLERDQSEDSSMQSSSHVETSENLEAQERAGIPLLVSIEADEGRPRYEVCLWDLESGNLEECNTIVKGLEPEGLQLFWNGGDYLAANPRIQCEDESVEVKSVPFGSSCYQDYILRYTDGFENDIWGDRTKLTLITGNINIDLDISTMTVPDGKYRPDELIMSSFIIDGEKLYVLFCPDMMLEKDLQLYITEIDLKDKSITGVTAFDAPKDCSPADPPMANNVFADGKKGFFVFGPDSVIQVNPHDMSVLTVFSIESFEEGTAPHFYIKSIGLYNEYVLIKGQDPNRNYYLFAIKDRGVVGTLETGERGFFQPNLA